MDREHSESSTDQAKIRLRLGFPSRVSSLCKKYATPQPMTFIKSLFASYLEPNNLRSIVLIGFYFPLFIIYFSVQKSICFYFFSFLEFFMLGGLKLMLKDLVLRV